MNPEPSASSPSSSADLWRGLQSRLQAARDDAFQQLHQQASPIDPTLPIREAEDKWYRESIRTREPVRDSVDHWIRTGKVEEPYEQYLLFLAARFETAHRFVRQFVFQQRGEAVCPFPFPDMTPDQVLAFLLGDWWIGVGMHDYFERAEARMAPPTQTK